MKKLTVLFFLLPFIVWSQTQIDNSSFEIWRTTAPIEPTPWHCNLKITVMGVPVYIALATKTTDAQSGQYATKLETKQQQSITMPGLLQLGNLDLVGDMNPRISGGYPFTSRPTGISFWYKYSPVENDTAWFFTIFTKYNSQTKKRDTVGATIFFFNKAVSTYQQATLPILFEDEQVQPDTVNVLFVSSSLLSPKIGSVLYVDNVEFLYTFYPFPTFALPAENITSNSFDACWIASPYTNNYILDVAKDEQFVQFVDGYQNKPVSANPADTFINYNVVIPQNEPQRDFFYRVIVDYGNNTYSVPSNTVMVTLPNPQSIAEYTNFGIYTQGRNIVVQNALQFDKIEIYDLQGYLIIDKQINSSLQTVTISQPGVYICKLKSSDRGYIAKIAIK